MTKTVKLFTVLLTLFSALAQTSCESDDELSSECEDAICTAILVRLMVSVRHENQNPVALDSFKVFNLENGGDMTISLSSSELTGLREVGRYPLIEDGVLEVNQERQIQFKGFVDNQEVVNGNYTVGTDCCHVGLVSGDLQLTF